MMPPPLQPHPLRLPEEARRRHSPATTRSSSSSSARAECSRPYSLPC